VLDRIRNAKLLVVIGSPGGSESLAIEEELRAFPRNKKVVVVIDIASATLSSRWFELIAGTPLVNETIENLKLSMPAPEVVDRIHGAFIYLRQDQRLRRLVMGSALCS